MMKKFYYNNQFSFYCGCPYEYRQIKGKEKTVVNGRVCGYIPRKNSERGIYIEWEHIVPAYAFGSTLKCWSGHLCINKNGKSYGGRK